MLRATLSAIALATAIGVAYLAMSMGLGGDFLLAEANTSFAIKSGLVYGSILTLFLNLFSFSDARKAGRTIIILTIGAHFLFGVSMMIWTAAMAGV